MRNILLPILVLAVTSGITALALSGSPSSANEPDREMVIENLKNPIDADSVESYRMRSTTTFTGSIAQAMRAETVELEAGLTENPKAARLHSEVQGPSGQSATSVQIDDDIWFNDGSGWQQTSAGQVQSPPWQVLADDPQRLTVTGTSIVFELTDVIEVAEFGGTEEIQGFNTVRYTLDNEDFRTLLNNLLYQAGAYECQQVSVDDQGNRTIDSSDCTEEDLQQDLGAGDNVNNFQAAVFLTGDGFVIRQNVTVELANLGQASDQPGTITVEKALYELNSDITIEPPSQ